MINPKPLQPFKVYAREDSCYGDPKSKDNKLEQVTRRLMNRLDQLEESIENIQPQEPPPPPVIPKDRTDEILEELQEQNVLCEKLGEKVVSVCEAVETINDLLSTMFNSHCNCGDVAEKVGAIKSLLSTQTRECNCNKTGISTNVDSLISLLKTRSAAISQNCEDVLSRNSDDGGVGSRTVVRGEESKSEGSPAHCGEGEGVSQPKRKRRKKLLLKMKSRSTADLTDTCC